MSNIERTLPYAFFGGGLVGSIWCQYTSIEPEYKNERPPRIQTWGGRLCFEKLVASSLPEWASVSVRVTR